MNGGNNSQYTMGIFALALLGVTCAGLILFGERFGSAEHRDLWQLGGAALGLILIIYGLILLLLRKMAMIQPRRADAEDELRGRWTKPVP
jgi:hypothetical protein